MTEVLPLDDMTRLKIDTNLDFRWGYIDGMRQRAADVEELLLEAKACIESVEDRSIFGVGGEGTTHWYLADELLTNINRHLGIKRAK